MERDEPRRLPPDVILRICRFLVPHLAQDSRSWTVPALDLVAYTSAHPSIWYAARIEVNRRLHLRQREGGTDMWERFQAVGDASKVEALPKRAPTRVTRAVTGSLSVQQDQRVALPTTIPSTIISAASIRHLSISLLAGACAFPSQEAETFKRSLAATLALLPRLESFALVVADEDTVTRHSPYATSLRIGYTLLQTLTALECLKSIHLCGIKSVVSFPPTSGPYVPPATLEWASPFLHEITFNACDDNVLRLLSIRHADPFASGWKEISIWRDYSALPELGVGIEEWWTVQSWKGVERLEMRGFSGSSAKDWCEAFRDSLLTLRIQEPKVMIPLVSLSLLEPYSYDRLMSFFLVLSHLPHFKRFHFLIWRTRRFNPCFFVEMAEQGLDGLEELSVGLENESGEWWPGSLTAYSIALANFSHLKRFIWNYSPYVNCVLKYANSDAYRTAAITLSSRTNKLEEIGWLGCGEVLRRSWILEGEGEEEKRKWGEWRWWRDGTEIWKDSMDAGGVLRSAADNRSGREKMNLV